MSMDAEFCAERAVEARRAAEGTNLPKVREQYLKAAEVWEDMARHAFKSAVLREEREEAARIKAQRNSTGLELAGT
jgi:hypothetical protein